MEKIPHRKVGLLLGTAPVTPWGTKNLYFTYRIDAAVKLFHAKKVDYFIVSGDNHSTDYDEPTCMRDSLVACGVPDERIISDYVGFRTLDLEVRCKAIFGQDSVTVISQSFHNERAIYLAGHNQIDAIAFNAQDVTSVWTTWLRGHSRELLARVKIFIDLIIGKQPRFWGRRSRFRKSDENVI
ncbi:ElyC/SanA/YdcF family protein [Parabacteroides goldsteinii]|uniref:SanA/YdcF family protein n=1 Tax=Parabacteroides goldsteinii TaxID=328812 RepID=UPI002ABADDAB|nr:ElyC/SanA/YdcF family protein [Parabacteroides goldsteinii]MDZ3928402.1 ElyC/SanA/YdcF family protein [Parabacteroides goldsteinii]